MKCVILYVRNLIFGINVNQDHKTSYKSLPCGNYRALKAE